jgi:hypothetical protein|tara:strand:+ start:318 stop:443 length:126 start_codon:yes stop_codon:yes gene_type:complete
VNAEADALVDREYECTYTRRTAETRSERREERGERARDAFQ